MADNIADFNKARALRHPDNLDLMARTLFLDAYSILSVGYQDMAGLPIASLAGTIQTMPVAGPLLGSLENTPVAIHLCCSEDVHFLQEGGGRFGNGRLATDEIMDGVVGSVLKEFPDDVEGWFSLHVSRDMWASIIPMLMTLPIQDESLGEITIGDRVLRVVVSVHGNVDEAVIDDSGRVPAFRVHPLAMIMTSVD